MELLTDLVEVVASNPIFAFVISVCVVGFYARPVSVSERARLVLRAEGSVLALKLASAATQRRYLTYFSYEGLLTRIDAIVRRENAEAVLAGAFRRNYPTQSNSED
jgi:hypothetical protein